ncbi:PVC-type heme-binding CxxCH protein [Tundrisphaera sp. TA3]|uniref:PVC-type heme-binding CxxCH protein n=1 Tax=Tundrisphaera sp. TA3 TaxID=3435775 RepID=UPI003EBC926D
MTAPRSTLRGLALFLILMAHRLDAGEALIDGRTLSVRDGFEVEAIAGPPLVDRPITGDFDEQGAFYVADSSGSNEPLAKQLENPTHRIVKLVDDDGDGRFDRRTVFADRMMFPAGTLWHDGSLYAAAPPSIWKLTDTDGDGVADRRTEWFQGKTLTGCGNDLHGPYLGPDGWIYWTKGAFAEQTYDRPGRSPLVTKASHIFRARPDGSGIEPVMTGGMDNPVDVAFSAGGERFFTTTFIQIPAGGRRDGILHAIYGGLYGKLNPAAEGHTRTRPDFMPVMTHLGAAAPSGLACYESSGFGDGFRGNLFAAQFNMRKVSRHVLVPDGATFRTQDEDFLASEDRDYHPTDVLEDADGSIVVIDTGGWYKLCCPTSQLEKPDVLGKIYRVRKAGASRVDDPRGLKLDWAKATPDALADRLGDPRPAVRRRAMDALGRRSLEALPALGRIVRGDDPEARRNAIWTSARIDAPEARVTARAGLNDPDEANRQAALHVASLHRDRGAIASIKPILAAPSRPNARAAAEALGRLGDPSVVPAILRAIDANRDPIVEHSLIHALIELNVPEPVRLGLDSPSPAVRLAAMIALDQMGSEHCGPDRVTPLLGSDDPRSREIAAWILGRHPAWGESVAPSFREKLRSPDLPEAARADLERQLGSVLGAPAIQALLAATLADRETPAEGRRIAARVMGRSGLKAAPEPWIPALGEALTSGDPALSAEAVRTVRSLPWGRSRPSAIAQGLLALARDAKAADPLRLAALTAMPGGLDPVGPADLRFLLDHLAADRPAPERSDAAEVLARAALSKDQYSALAGAIRAASPLEVERLALAFERTKDDAAGLALVDALEHAEARSAIRVGVIRPILDRFGPPVREAAGRLYASLHVDEAAQVARLREKLGRIDGGDVRRGQAVFNGPKAACSTCHAIGYLGGKVGPDLSKIGQIRGKQDLLEAILYPSASFVRGYEPVAVALQSGQVQSGIVKEETPDSITLTLGADREARIPREEVESIRPGDLSVMPAGLDQVLSDAELADLIAFLATRK